MPEALSFRFDHVHVYCTNLSEMESWFVDGLGAEVLRRVESPRSTSVFLSLGGAQIIVRPAEPGESLVAPTQRQFGTHHFGLLVDDLDRTAAELKRRGVKFELEPMQYRPGVRISYVVGPDDVRVELLERHA